jgi:hypothetical protein
VSSFGFIFKKNLDKTQRVYVRMKFCAPYKNFIRAHHLHEEFHWGTPPPLTIAFGHTAAMNNFIRTHYQPALFH